MGLATWKRLVQPGGVKFFPQKNFSQDIGNYGIGNLKKSSECNLVVSNFSQNESC